MIETAGGSAFVFITTDPRNKPTREAIKVHVLRQRRQSRTHDYSGLLAPSVTGHPGGEFHIWDFAAEGRTPRSSETATLPLDNDEAAPSSALVQIDQVVLGGPSSGSMASPDDPLLSLETRGREVVTVSSLFSGGSDELLAHYYVLSGGGSEIPRKLLPYFKISAASFSAFLAISSSRYGDKRSDRSQLDAHEKEVQALGELAKQITLSPAAPTTGTMLAVALLANLQELRNEPDLAEWHWTGLKRMVDMNGGLDHLEMDEGVHTFFFWLDALVCSATVVPLGHMSPDNSTMQPRPPEPILELTYLLERISTSLLSDQSPEMSRVGTEASISRVLHRSGLHRDTYTMVKSFRAKLACLLYFSLLKLQYKTSLRNITVYQAIAQEVEHRERGYSVQPEELYYIILALGNQDGLRHLIYAVSRMVYAAKKLGRNDCQVAARLLSAFTSHPDPFDDSNEMLNDWQDLTSRLPTMTKKPLIGL